jgi:hypothetical protein
VATATATAILQDLVGRREALEQSAPVISEPRACRRCGVPVVKIELAKRGQNTPAVVVYAETGQTFFADERGQIRGGYRAHDEVRCAEREAARIIAVERTPEETARPLTQTDLRILASAARVLIAHARCDNLAIAWPFITELQGVTGKLLCPHCAGKGYVRNEIASIGCNPCGGTGLQ